LTAPGAGSAADSQAELLAVVADLNRAAESLWQRIEPWLPGWSVEVAAEVDSTSTALMTRLRADPSPTLLVAARQTHGRGRLGRHWQSAVGDSLTFSLALPLAPADWSGLSLAVGVAIAQALDPLRAGSAPRLMLKWPNDLFLCESPGRGRKLGGVLIETLGLAGTRVAVVGVGINLRAFAVEAAATGVASLAELGESVGAGAVLTRIVPALVRALLDFECQGFVGFAEQWRGRDLLAGQLVTTTSPELPGGRADGVDASGALRIVVDGGGHGAAAVRLLNAGDVSVRRADAGDRPC
jgi:BirA family biotin operon repressor/biotin-[acetyl-CoA-carboxylase] ligase